MRCAILVAVGLASAIAACQSTPAAQPRPTVRPAATPATTALPAAPLTGPSKAATQAKAPPPALVAPASAFSELTGTVSANASYLLSDAGASLVSNNGGSVLALGGGGLLSNNSGNLVASTQGGSALVDANGSFVAAGNAGLLSNNSGNLISDHGAGYRLAASEPSRPASTSLPAAGLAVSAVSLRTHAYVPLGRTPDGQPVFTIYSDAKGQYKLYLPASETGNVVVVANVPQTLDRRLVFNVVAPAAGSQGLQLDDDTANGTRLARRILSAQMAPILTSTDVGVAQDAIVNGDIALPASFKQGLAKLVATLYNAARDSHVPNGPGAADLPDVQALCALIADQALADLSYDDMRLSPLFDTEFTGSQERTFDASAGAFGVLREAAGRYLDARRAAGETLPITIHIKTAVYAGTQAAPMGCTYDNTLALVEPSDACAYVVDDVLSRVFAYGIFNTQATFAALATHDTPGVLDLSALQPGDPEYYQDPEDHTVHAASLRLKAATGALLGNFALALVPPDEPAGSPPNAALARLVTSLTSFAKDHSFQGPPVPRPRLGTGTPCEPVPGTPIPAAPCATVQADDRV